MLRFTSILLAGSMLVACGGDDSSTPDGSNTVAFDLTGGDELFAMPYPSDLRLKEDLTIDLSTFPNPRQLPIVNDLLSSAVEHHRFPVMPIAYFRFTGEAPAKSITDVILGAADQSAVLVDIDATSPEKGAMYPLVAYTLPKDGFTGDGLVAVAPRPGAVLRPSTQYAFVLKKDFAPGVDVPADFTTLENGGGDEKASALYAPLWTELDALQIAKKDLLVATVFTTGDAVQEMWRNSELARVHRTPTIDNLAIDTEHGVNHPDVCVLAGTITYPQFQKGTQPFSTEGRFDIDPELGPVQQGEMIAPVRITIPKGVMPSGGWPLWQYIHGSGGASFDLVDEGYNTTADSGPMLGEGPGVVVGRRGIAAAASAMPVNPERLPNADAQAYLNFSNLAALPYTFQQGVIEQRLLLDALLALDVTPAMLNGCGATLPEGKTFGSFDAAHVMLGGHSMGGMYTNMLGAVEPRFNVLTPFGAGGFWNLMILNTEVVANGRELLAGILGVDGETLTFTHPVLAMLGTGWEVAEPGASMARIARRPLENTPARSVYEPVGLDDRYFPNEVYDAAALAYGNNEAGTMVWPGTQEALETEGLDGIVPYPVKQNRVSGSAKTTSVVVQYSDGGLVDAHQIYRQLPEVRFQYSCFLASYLRDGVPTVFAPAGSNRSDENAPCPAAP
ncbi:MAG TPA: hypothetical protein VGM39_11870 [Kofleriaceae bacterium]